MVDRLSSPPPWAELSEIRNRAGSLSPLLCFCIWPRLCNEEKIHSLIAAKALQAKVKPLRNLAIGWNVYMFLNFKRNSQHLGSQWPQNGPRFGKTILLCSSLLKAFIKIKHACTHTNTNTILFKDSFINLGVFCFLHQINRTMSHWQWMRDDAYIFCETYIFL